MEIPWNGMGQTWTAMEWDGTEKYVPWTSLATRILLRRRGLKPKVKILVQQFSNLYSMLNKLMQLKRITEGARGGNGQNLQPLGEFRDFAAKIATLTPFQSQFERFWNHINNYSKLLRFRRPRMAVRYGTFRICVLRTSHLEPYRTNVPYPYRYKKSVPYQRTVLLSKNWGVPYLRTVPYCHPCSGESRKFVVGW